MFPLLFLLGTLALPINGFRLFGGNLGLSDFLYIAALLALVFDWLMSKESFFQFFPWHPFWIAGVLIFIGGIFSTLVAASPLGSLVTTLKASFVFSLWMSMGIAMVLRYGQTQRLVIALMALPFFSASVSVWDELTGSVWGPTISRWLGNRFENLNLEYLTHVVGRHSGITQHPNIQSEITVVMIPLALVPAIFAWRAKNWMRALVLTFVALIFVTANFLTGSVSGLICVTASLLIVLGLGWLREFSRWVVPSIVAATIMLFLMLLAFSLEIIPFASLRDELIANPNVARAVAFTGPSRLELASEAASSITQNPLTGYGMDLLTGQADIEPEDAPGYTVHTAILRSFYFGGVFVFLGVLYAYWRALGLSFVAMVRYLRGYREPLVLGLAISILAWVLNDLAQPSFYQRFTWMTAMLLYALLIRAAKRFNAPSKDASVARAVSQSPAPQPSGASSFRSAE